jgi:hypothetical protein
MHKGKRVNIVIHDKKFVFMMLKKCASVTMGKVILESLGHKNTKGNNVNKILRTLDRFNKYDVDGLDYTKVVWVRNPFDRLVSGWFDRIHKIKNKNTMNWYGIPNTISFPDFIYWVCSIDDDNMNVHFKQQTIDITIGNRIVPNIVMRLETLQEDWKQLQSKFNWLIDLKYHEHKSTKGDYRDYYTNDLIEKVNNRFAKDLELLKYKF